MSVEEREILDGFERGELRSASGAERELQEARQAARNTFNKTRRVNLRMTERASISLTRGRGKKGSPIRRYYPASSTSTCLAD